MPEQDNLEFRKKTYKNLKTAFGDDYTLTEEQFNKNMDSDTAFVTKTYKNLKTAYGDDYAVGEEDFKKKVLPVSGKPTTSASGSGSAPTQPLNGSGDSRGRNPKISFLADIVTELNPDAPKLKEGQSVEDWGKELTTFAKQYPLPKEGEPWKKEDSITRMRYKLAQKNQNFEEFVDERLPQVEGMTERDKNLFLYKEYLKENNPTALKKYEESRAYKTDAPGVAAKLLLDTSPEDTERIDAEFYDKALEMSQNYLNIKYKKLNELTATPQFKELMNVNQSAAQEMDALNKSYESGNIDRENYESNAAEIKQRYDQSWAEIAPVMETANKLQSEAQKNLIEASEWINRFPNEAKRRMEEKAQDATNEVLYDILPSHKMAANVTNQIGRGVTEFIANTFSLPQVLSKDSEYGWSDRLADVSQEWASAVNKDLFPVPKKMEKGIVNTDYSVNWDLVLPKTVRTLTDMAIMSASGNPAGMVATSFSMNAKSYYDEALAQRMNTQDASKFAVSMAMQQSLLELVNPEYALIKRGLTKMATKDATRMLSEGVSLPDAIKATAKAMGKNMVMENAQEQMQLFGDMTGKMAANIITGSDFEFDDIGQQVTESLLLTSIVSALGGGGIGASQNSRSELEKRAIYSAVDSPELLLEATQKAVAAGTLDPIAAQRINLTVGELKQNLDALPANVKDTERSEVVNALFDKNKLVQIAANEALDPAIKKVYEDKIKEIDASVGKIISKYVTPEKVEEVVKPTATEGVVETADVIVPEEEVMAEETITPTTTNTPVTEDIVTATETVTPTTDEIVSEKEVFSDAINTNKVYILNGETGNILVDGQTVVFETPTKIVEIGNIEDVSNKDISIYGLEQEQELDIEVGDDFSVKIDGESYVNNYSNPQSAITELKDGSYSVSLETPDGKKRTFRGQRAEQIAYNYKLKQLQNATDEQIGAIESEADEIIQSNTKVGEPSIERSDKIAVKAPEIITPAQSEAVKEDTTTNTTTDGKETDQGQKELLSNVTEDAAPIPEAPPLTPAETVVKEAAPSAPKIFVSKKGNSIEKDAEGKVIVRDKKGKELSGRERSLAIGEFVREKIASKAGRISDKQLEEDNVTEQNIAQYIAENSKNAGQILEAIANLRPDEVAVERDRIIEEAMTGISEESFNKESDRNLMTDTIRKNYIRKEGRDIDEIAQSASYAMFPDGDGTEISVEDVVKFIHNYPSGYKGKSFDPNKKALYDAFEQLTGVRPTPAMVRSLSSKKQMENDEDFAGLEPDLEAPPTPTKGSEKKERSFTKQAMKSPDISGESKAKIKEEAIYYMTQRNVMSVAEANKIIDDVGLEEAIKILKDFNNGINGGVRGALGQIIIKQLESRGETDEAIDVLNWLTQEATDSGQFIQAFSLWAALTAQGQIRAAQKMIKDQRESRAKKQKAKITAVKEGMKAAAKEAIDEALVSTGVKAGVKLSNKRSSPTYGAKNKITTREEYLEAKAKLRGKLFSNPLDSNLIPIAAYHLEASGRKIADFTANLIDEFGGGVRPYIKPMYEKAKAALIERGAKESDFDNEKDIEQQIQEAQNLYWEEEGKKVIAKLDRAIKTKNDKAYKEAIAELQSLPNRDELWGKYKEYAAKRLANLSMKQFAKDANEKPVLQNFTDELARTMQDKIKEALPESERTTTEPRPVIEVIADAFKNKEKYQEVWDEVQSNLRDQLTNEQLAELDAYFGNILDTPFSQKQISKAVKDGLASIDKKVADIARAHYTQYDVAKRTLTQKLIAEAQLPEDQAAQLAEAISKEFDRIMTEKKKKLLDDMFKKRVISKKQKVNLETELQTLLNLGAFNDDMFVEQWAKANGYPVLTAENIAEIERLSKIIQEQPDGSKKFRAIQDLLKYQGSIKGVNWKEVGMAIWYANILSGYNTQLVNAFSTSLNVASNYIVSLSRDPKGAKFLAQGFYRGFTHGILEGAEVLRTGYDPVLKGKLELPATLEIKRFAGGKFNPANYLKYVRRVMMATDVLFFEGAKEMRAYQLARSMAKDEAKLDPSLDVQKRAEAILNKTDYDQQIINEEVELEYQSEVDRINAMSVSNDIKNKLLTQAKRDKSRRAFEKAHLGRKESIIEGAASFASRSTYNYKPEGALGYIVNGINTVLHKMPALRLVIPFTNIIANVANEQINYTPVGFWRAYKDGSITGGRKNEITPLEKSELYAKAALGTTLMAATLVAAILPVGDDDEPLIEITANGTGDYVKNYNLKDWMPYSIRVKGGKWVSYQYSPMMVGLSVIGNLMDGEKYRGEKLKDESTLTKFSLAMSASMRVFLDMTFLASLNSALDIIMNPFNPNVADTFAKSAQSTAKGFAIPNLYNQSFKQVQASFDIPNKMVRDTYLGWLLKDIPVARDMYKDQLDILGNPVVPNTDKFVKDGSDITPIYRLIQNQMPNMRVPSIKVAKVTDPKTDEETKMTEAEYYVFCQIRGNYIKQEILKADKERKLSTLDKDWATQTQSDATEIAEDKIYQLRQSYLK